MPLVDIADELYALPAGRVHQGTGRGGEDATPISRGDQVPQAPDRQRLAGQPTRPTRSDRLGELLDPRRRAAHRAGRPVRRRPAPAQPRASSTRARRRGRGARARRQAHRPGRARIESTLDAALADPDAGEAVRTGRLVRALTSAGFESVDLTARSPYPEAAPAPRRSPGRTAVKAAPRRRPPSRRRTRRTGASRTHEGAHRGRAACEEARCPDEQVDAARERIDTARAEIDELEAELKQARCERAAAEKEIEKAQRERNAAAREHRDAQQRLDKLER